MSGDATHGDWAARTGMPPGSLALPRTAEHDTPARSWRPVLEAFCGTLNSPHTIRSYRYDVEQAMYRLRVRNLRELTGAMLMLWRGEVIDGPGAPLSKFRRIVSVRSFLRFGARVGACPHLTRDVLDVSLPVPPADAEEGHRPITDDALALLLEACEGAQDRAVIAVLCSAAPRRAELAALDCTDVVSEEGGWLLRIRRGKGGWSRTTPLVDDVGELVLRHLADGGRIPGDEGPLFVGASGGRIRDDEVYGLVRRLASAAGMRREGISPHDLRATAAMRVYRHTKDIYAVQALLGHRDLNTTQRYLRDLTAGELRSSIPPLPGPAEVEPIVRSMSRADVDAPTRIDEAVKPPTRRRRP